MSTLINIWSDVMSGCKIILAVVRGNAFMYWNMSMKNCTFHFHDCFIWFMTAEERASLILHGLWNVRNYIYVFILGDRGRRAGHTDYLLMTTACQPRNADKYFPKQIVSLIAGKQTEKEYQFSLNLESRPKKSNLQSKTIKVKILDLLSITLAWRLILDVIWWQFCNNQSMSKARRDVTRLTNVINSE